MTLKESSSVVRDICVMILSLVHTVSQFLFKNTTRQLKRCKKKSHNKQNKPLLPLKGFLSRTNPKCCAVMCRDASCVFRCRVWLFFFFVFTLSQTQFQTRLVSGVHMQLSQSLLMEPVWCCGVCRWGFSSQPVCSLVCVYAVQKP